MSQEEQRSAAQQEPPRPPYFERRIDVPRPQIVGVGLLALVPLAALFGAFGLRSGHAAAEGDGVSLEVQYPALLRYQMSMSLELRVRNTGSRPLAQASARIDERWLSRFSDAQLTPQPRQVTERVFEIALPDVPAGEERKVVGTLRAHDYGRHAGAIAVAIGDRIAVQVDVHTTVLP